MQEIVLVQWPAAAHGPAGPHQRAKIARQNSDGTYGVIYMEGDGSHERGAAAADTKTAPAVVQYCPTVAAALIKKMPPYTIIRRVRTSMFGDTLKQTFDACDIDKDGRISREEFRAAISALEIMCSKDEIDQSCKTTIAWYGHRP